MIKDKLEFERAIKYGNGILLTKYHQFFIDVQNGETVVDIG